MLIAMQSIAGSDDLEPNWFKLILVGYIFLLVLFASNQWLIYSKRKNAPPVLVWSFALIQLSLCVVVALHEFWLLADFKAYYNHLLPGQKLPFATSVLFGIPRGALTAVSLILWTADWCLLLRPGGVGKNNRRDWLSALFTSFGAAVCFIS